MHRPTFGEHLARYDVTDADASSTASEKLRGMVVLDPGGEAWSLTWSLLMLLLLMPLMPLLPPLLPLLLTPEDMPLPRRRWARAGPRGGETRGPGRCAPLTAPLGCILLPVPLARDVARRGVWICHGIWGEITRIRRNCKAGSTRCRSSCSAREMDEWLGLDVNCPGEQ